MNSIICKDCRRQSLLSQHTQAVRCHGCGRFISISNNQERGSLSTKNQPSQENAKIRGRIRDFLKKTSSVNISPYVAIPRFSITSMPPPRGKRAFLCGVSYKGQKIKVRGALQDVKSMTGLLVERFKFPASSILILAEEEPYKLPTKKNVQEAFQWLMADLQSGDSLVFYFSGHGKRQRDDNGDEMDGFDEAICPLDFETEGMILDNEINETIVRPLKKGVILHAIIDACHSGTMLDLSYVYNKDKGKWDDNRPPSGAHKDTSGGQAICFSACEDYQLAADISAFTSGKIMSGAMTHTFIKAVKANPKVTYRGILYYMQEAIEEADKAGCSGTCIFRGFNHKIIQDPQLSSSEAFDINSEFKL